MSENEPIAFGPKAVDQIAQTVREVARRMQNETPHRGRWQQQPGGGVELSHGIILEVCNAGCSTYRVQRIHRYLTPNCDESGSGS